MYDLIIKNARVIDGTNSPWYRGDIGIKNGKIKKIGVLDKADSQETVDAEEHYLTSGFIDIHSHSDSTLFDYPLAEKQNPPGSDYGNRRELWYFAGPGKS